MKIDMSTVETKIIHHILNGNSKLKFDPKLYECTSTEFYNAVENIKNKMSLVGIEGN